MIKEFEQEVRKKALIQIIEFFGKDRETEIIEMSKDDIKWRKLYLTSEILLMSECIKDNEICHEMKIYNYISVLEMISIFERYEQVNLTTNITKIFKNFLKEDQKSLEDSIRMLVWSRIDCPLSSICYKDNKCNYYTLESIPKDQHNLYHINELKINIYEIANLFYSIRGNVTHHGQFWSPVFMGEDDTVGNWYSFYESGIEKTYEFKIKLSDFHNIMIKNIFNMIKSK